MDEIRWEDPPETRGQGSTKWLGVLRPLMAHPKRWAVVKAYPHSKTASAIVTNLRRRKLGVPPGQWEFASRTVGDECRVYARYLGPDENGGAL